MDKKYNPRKTAQRLFTSKTRWGMLELFFSNPEGWFFMRELARSIDQQLNAVRREIIAMVSEGLILKRADSNKAYFKTNPDHPLYSEIYALVKKVREDNV